MIPTEYDVKVDNPLGLTKEEIYDYELIDSLTKVSDDGLTCTQTVTIKAIPKNK